MAAQAERKYYGFFRQRQIGFREEPHPWTFDDRSQNIIDTCVTVSELKKTSTLDTDIMLMVFLRTASIQEIRRHPLWTELFSQSRTSAGLDNVPAHGWSGDTEFTIPATRVLANALEIAWHNNAEKIEEKHLLAALVKEREGAASRIFDALKIDRDNLVLCPVPDKFRPVVNRIHVGRSW